MNAALHVPSVHPIERAAHRAGSALVRWSVARAEQRVRRTVVAGASTASRTAAASPTTAAASPTMAAASPSTGVTGAHRAVLHRAALDREARERSWDTLASTAPRLR